MRDLSHRDNYYQSLKKVQNTRNDFSHLVGVMMADTSSFDMADMFHTVLQFLGKPAAVCCMPATHAATMCGCLGSSDSALPL